MDERVRFPAERVRFMFVILSIGVVAHLIFLGIPPSLNRFSPFASLCNITVAKWWECFKATLTKDCQSLIYAYRILSATRKRAKRRTPETNVVHSRKCHIRSSNHYWNKPVSKTSHKSRHYNEKLHLQPVSSNQK